MGSKLIYKGIFKPIYEQFGDTMNYYVNRSHEELYDFNKEVGDSLKQMQGAGGAVKMAMEMHAADSSAKKKDK